MTTIPPDTEIRVSVTHQMRLTRIAPGDKVDIEFPDGTGVSGTFAGVDIAPGGTPFSLIVTHDGEWPEQEYTVEVGGQRFTRAQWEAAETCIRGTTAKTARQEGELRETIGMIQERGYVVQEIEDYNAGLRHEYERARRDIEQRMASDASPEDEPFQFQVAEGEEPTLETFVFQALGAASICWSNPSGAGTFDSTRAKEIGDALCATIRESGYWNDTQGYTVDACEAVTDEPEGIDRTAAERVLRRLLRASTARVQELERMTQIQENELNEVQTELVRQRGQGKTVVINNAAPAPIRSRTTVQAGPITVQYEELS